MNGEKIAGFEYDIIVPIRDWIHIVLDLNQLDHPLAIRVLQIAQQLVRYCFFHDLLLGSKYMYISYSISSNINPLSLVLLC